MPAAFAFSVAAGLDETVLVHGAGGGVGVGATQLAKLRGATVIGTASAAKHEAIRALGVDHAIDYRTAKVVDEVTRLTNGAAATSSSIRLAAAVLPTAIGCSRRSVARSLRRVANRRRRTAQPVARRDDDRHDAAVQSAGADEPQPWCVREPLADAVLLLLDEIGGGRLRPIVARTFALEHAADAHRFVQSRSNTGKLVLTISR